LLMHATHAMQGVLAELARGDLSFAGRGVGFEEYKDIVGFDRWSRIESYASWPPHLANRLGNRVVSSVSG
jgi:hypothetical protein